MSIPSIVYKAHATGNDFVVYLDAEGTYEPTADEVRFLCDRHFGIGGDGLIRLVDGVDKGQAHAPRHDIKLRKNRIAKSFGGNASAIRDEEYRSITHVT